MEENSKEYLDKIRSMAGQLEKSRREVLRMREIEINNAKLEEDYSHLKEFS